MSSLLLLVDDCDDSIDSLVGVMMEFDEGDGVSIDDDDSDPLMMNGRGSWRRFIVNDAFSTPLGCILPCFTAIGQWISMSNESILKEKGSANFFCFLECSDCSDGV